MSLLLRAVLPFYPIIIVLVVVEEWVVKLGYAGCCGPEVCSGLAKSIWSFLGATNQQWILTLPLFFLVFLCLVEILLQTKTHNEVNGNKCSEKKSTLWIKLIVVEA